MKFRSICIFLLLPHIHVFCQQAKHILPQSLGVSFTPQAELEAFCNRLIESNPQEFKRIDYGHTPEGRPLFLIVRSSKENMRQLDTIRRTHLINSGLEKGKSRSENHLIVWLGFNIHGDEASGTETALALLNNLANTDMHLEKVLIIDPNQNPDGRSRYIKWFENHPSSTNSSHKGEKNDILWPEGRFNYYMSDLNRDWAWQVQAESKQRNAVYRQWMPHVFADFHEMEPEKDYFFPPFAQPVHELIQSYQIEIYRNLADDFQKLFHRKNWDYFSEQKFDLFYPGYADSYTSLHGGIGLTFEQGGSAEAGILYVKKNGDTLKLADRIEKHLAIAEQLLTSLDKVEHKLIQQFQNFHTENLKISPAQTDTYLIRNSEKPKLQKLLGWLKQWGLEYRFVEEPFAFQGLSYRTKKHCSSQARINDLVIQTDQPQGKLLKALFEPHSKMGDYKTYDVSAWSIPYLLHLDAFAISKLDSPLHLSETAMPLFRAMERASKFVRIKWNVPQSALWLTKSLSEGLDVFLGKFRPDEYLYFEHNPKAKTKELITGADSLQLNVQFLDRKAFFHLVDKKAGICKVPRIGILIGPHIDEPGLGDILHFLEKEIHIRYTKIWANNLASTDLLQFDVLIFPDGFYRGFQLPGTSLRNWVLNGGKVLALGDGLSVCQQIGIGQLHPTKLNNIGTNNKNTDNSSLVQGALFRVNMEKNPILSRGLKDGHAHVYLQGIPRFTATNENPQACTLGLSGHLAGFVGADAQKELNNALVFNTVPLGKGFIHQFMVNPLFRGILADGQMVFCNALFLP